KENVQIPHLLRMAVISNTEFYDLYVTVTKYRRELAKIRDRSGEMGEALTRKLIDAVETRHHENRIALGIKISELLQGLSESLENLDIQVTEIRIEIDEVKAEELAKQVDELAQGKQEEADVAAAQKRASIFVGDKYITWGFEGEYWSDEINNYRSNLEDVCK
ncbi:hypothetical protein KKF91_21330, partial [Myxococcota bacterium]|nr:hypothetical protein [Myxococcota bacterium]